VVDARGGALPGQVSSANSVDRRTRLLVIVHTCLGERSQAQCVTRSSLLPNVPRASRIATSRRPLIPRRFSHRRAPDCRVSVLPRSARQARTARCRPAGTRRGGDDRARGGRVARASPGRADAVAASSRSNPPLPRSPRGPRGRRSRSAVAASLDRSSGTRRRRGRQRGLHRRVRTTARSCVVEGPTYLPSSVGAAPLGMPAVLIGRIATGNASHWVVDPLDLSLDDLSDSGNECAAADRRCAAHIGGADPHSVMTMILPRLAGRPYPCVPYRQPAATHALAHTAGRGSVAGSGRPTPQRRGPERQGGDEETCDDDHVNNELGSDGSVHAQLLGGVNGIGHR